MTFRKIARLSATHYWRLWQAAWVVMAVKLALHWLSFDRFRRFFQSITTTTYLQTYDAQTLTTVAWAIGAVSRRWPWRAVCLPQALAFKYILRGDETLQLHIGVNKSPKGDFQAHAWVEKEGEILIGDTIETFQKLWTWGSLT